MNWRAPFASFVIATRWGCVNRALNMSEREMNYLVMHRLGASVSRLRRCQVNSRVRRQRLRWQWEVKKENWLKRWFDVVFSACVLVAISPLLLLIALLIKLEDGGPIRF